MKMDTSDFDLDKYLRASNRVDLSSVEWDRIREHPVTVEEARCLTYLMDIETHTVVVLRDLLATRASFDPEVTAFLSCWAYEELWHGEAFSRFLGQAGYRVPPSYEHVEGDAPVPTRFDRNQWIRRKFGTKGYVSHMGTLLGSAVGGAFLWIVITTGAAWWWVFGLLVSVLMVLLVFVTLVLVINALIGDLVNPTSELARKECDLVGNHHDAGAARERHVNVEHG